jgi:glycosyltransferase involved in cell wall biosynthesis
VQERIDAIELDQGAVDAFVARALEFDVVWCEIPEAVVLHAEITRRGGRPPGILALDVHGLHRVELLRSHYLAAHGLDPWPAMLASERVHFIGASNIQYERLLAAGIAPSRAHRLSAAAVVYQLMLPDADERLSPECTTDGALAPEVPFDAVLVAGTGRRDPDTWLEAAALLPDVPFVAVGESAESLAAHRARLELPELANVRAVPTVPLESFIAAVRRSRVCVVCLKPGDADGGHTTVCIAQTVGVPVIASRVPGVIDYVDDGVSARVVPPADPRALATSIRWLWESRETRERLVRGGLAAEVVRRDHLGPALLEALRRASAQ